MLCRLSLGYQAGRPISCSLSTQPEPRKRKARRGCQIAVNSLQHGGSLTIEYPESTLYGSEIKSSQSSSQEGLILTGGEESVRMSATTIEMCGPRQRERLRSYNEHLTKYRGACVSIIPFTSLGLF